MKQGNLFRVYLLNCRLSLMGGVDAAVLLFIWSYATAFYKIRVGDKLQNGIWAFPNQTTPTGRRDLRPGDLSGMLEKLRAVEVGG